MRAWHMRKYKLFCGVALCAMTINAIAPIAAAAAEESGSNDGNTTTPIKHVIVIIGENRTFDHLFATYVPKHKSEKVLNLLSQGIVNADGTPGPNYSAATQYRAIDNAPDPYLISPPKAGAYNAANPFPAPLANGGPPPFSTVAEAHTYEYGLPPGYYKYLTTGAVPAYLDGKPDMRIYYDGKDVNHQVWPVPADQYGQSYRSHHELRRLRREPGAPVLPHVAAARLHRLPWLPE